MANRRKVRRIERRAFVLMMGIAAVWGMAKLYGPVAANHRQQAELAALRLEKSALLATRERLESYKRRLASDAGLETAARVQGYLRDGERRLVFTTKPEPAPAASAKPGAKRAAAKTPTPDRRR